ncbi:MAG TPA: hypothetical protein VEU29_07950 [Actinomycetota bacterium]|nr:hypothetical protein [Actinomycetota bacterium]
MNRIVGSGLTCMFLVASLVAPSAASAAASVGASANCEVMGAQCVAGAGQSENAGTSTTGGYATAVCTGQSNGAMLIEVSCSVAGRSSTVSLPGPAGVAFVVAPTESFTRQPVCWTVTGYFLQPLGGVNEVTTSGCSIVSL